MKRGQNNVFSFILFIPVGYLLVKISHLFQRAYFPQFDDLNGVRLGIVFAWSIFFCIFLLSFIDGKRWAGMAAFVLMFLNFAGVYWSLGPYAYPWPVWISVLLPFAFCGPFYIMVRKRFII